MPLQEHEVFSRIGEDGFARVAAEFYRQVPKDEILGPMYPANDLTGAEMRLRDFLIYRFGGPQKYIEERGHPRLRMRHAPFAIDVIARDRWMKLMNHALDTAKIADDARDLLRNFFEQMATFLINRQ